MAEKNVENFSVDLAATMKDAMETLNQARGAIVFVVDSDKKLKGTITDGDIRRGLLDGATIQSAVTKIMNPAPIICTRGVNEHEAQMLMQKNHIRTIPVLDKNGVLIDFHSINEHADSVEDTLVVIMAGGRGERLAPLTKDTPKSLLKVGSRPILENILEGLARDGFKKFYFSVNYMADSIKSHFQDGSPWGVEISYLEEKSFLGTVGSLSLIEKPVEKPFIVMNADLMTKVDFHALLAFHKQSGALATLCVREHTIQIPYGVVSVDNTYVTDIVEKPVQQSLVNAGIYVLDPACLGYIPKGQYFDMPALMKAVLADKERVASFPIHEYWLDIGRLEDLQRAREDYVSKGG